MENGQIERLRHRLEENNERWKRLSDKLSKLQEAKDYETDVVRGLRLDKEIKATEAERTAVEQELTALETSLRAIADPKDSELSVVDPLSLNKEAAWGIDKVNARTAWERYNVRGADVTIGLVTTGIDASHPDLEDKISAWAEFDSDGSERPNSDPVDSHGLGTHSAGILVGGNASGHWIGVAPEAKLAVAKVFDETQGSDAQILAGLDWSLKQGVDVILVVAYRPAIGLQREAPSAYDEAFIKCTSAGIPVVAPIGNNGAQTVTEPGSSWVCFGVGATDYRDRPAGFSGGGTLTLREDFQLGSSFQPPFYSKPDVSAPGVAILSSAPGPARWRVLSGTSMAAAHAAGAIAPLLSSTSIRQTLTTARLTFVAQDLIKNSVEDLGEAGQDHRYGYGRVDVLRAIRAAHEDGY
jgi:subtilisin family serine protease